MNRAVQAWLSVLLCIAGACFMASTAMCSELELAIYLTEPNFKTPCLESFEDADVSGEITPSVYLAHVVLVSDASDPAVSAIKFGINYDSELERGVDVFGWHTCGASEIPAPGWPESGSLNTVIWAAADAPISGSEWGLPGKSIRIVGAFFVGAYSVGTLSFSGPSGGIPVLRVDGSSAAIPTELSEKTGLERRGSTNMSHSPLGYLNFSNGKQIPGYSPIKTDTGLEDRVAESRPASNAVGARWYRETARGSIFLSLAVAQEAEVDIFDVAGRKVRRLASGRFELGLNTIPWDGRVDRGTVAANGMYLVRARVGEQTMTTKLVVAR